MAGSGSTQSHDFGTDRVLLLSDSDRGTRLDRSLATGLGISRRQVRHLLEQGAVSLGGRTLSLADKGMALPSSGRLCVRRLEPTLPDPAPNEPRVAVVAEGAGWLAFDKPAGMPIHPLEAGETGSLLGHAFSLRPEIFGVGEGGLRSGVVHRLDISTSGVVLMASEEQMWQRLRSAFQNHRVQKVYRAILEGVPQWPASGLDLSLDLRVAQHRPARVRVATEMYFRRGRGYPVRQKMRVLEVLDGASLVEVQLETGFLHQIRATLSHLGHPLVGDAHYGAQMKMDSVLRPLLHACRTAFEEISAEAADADDFHEALVRLRV